jgi:magnesium-transporting ATPase (P-type)
MIWTISLFAHPLALMLFKFSRRCNLPDLYQSPNFRLVITLSPVLLLSIHLTQLYQTNSFAPTTTSTLPRVKFIVFPVSIIVLLRHLIRTRLRYFSMFRSCHGSLSTNRRFDLIHLR